MSKKLSYRLSKSVTENFERLLKSGGYKEDALNKFDLYVTPYFNEKKKPVFEGDNNTVLFVALNNPYGVESIMVMYHLIPLFIHSQNLLSVMVVIWKY